MCVYIYIYIYIYSIYICSICVKHLILIKIKCIAYDSPTDERAKWMHSPSSFPLTCTENSSTSLWYISHNPWMGMSRMVLYLFDGSASCWFTQYLKNWVNCWNKKSVYFAYIPDSWFFLKKIWLHWSAFLHGSNELALSE